MTEIEWAREYLLQVSGPPHNNRHLTLRNLETAYENSLVLVVNDGPHPGPTRERDDSPKITRRLAALQREQGRVNVYTPKEERERRRPCNETLRADLEWHNHNWRSHWSQVSSSSSTDWWESSKSHETHQGEWHDQHWWEE